MITGRLPIDELPIGTVLPSLLERLAHASTVVLQADPGAGKSTVVPLALLDAPWLADRKILLLQPRRLAARSIAQRMAETLGESVGQTVGYRMRLARKTGPKTRIEVLTEGMLTRRLQNDPLLDDVGCILFDEFHERSLQADLGLALARDVQQGLRDDLRLLVMSATFDGDALAERLDAPLVRAAGRCHPVETFYVGTGEPPSAGRIARVVIDAITAHPGDVLVFLPGVGEIRRVEAALAARLPEHCLITPLHGGLTLAAQRRAIAPAPPGQRKVVLATAVAETSLTIEGVRIVVDAGLARLSRFDPRSGMSGLVTQPASRASADQRRGRAGRVDRGWCYRLWSEAAHQRRPAEAPPEIERADLAPLALELLQWGVTDPATLFWTTPPPGPSWRRALGLLQQLGIIDPEQRLTPHGRSLGGLGLHPRLAHMLVTADRLGDGVRACHIAALLLEKSPFPAGLPEPDFGQRLALLEGDARPDGLDRGVIERARQQSAALRRRLGNPDDQRRLGIGALCALAYPDRIGQRRPGPRPIWRLSGGGAAFFPAPNAISDATWLVMTELDGRAREARIFSAATVSLPELEALFGDRIETIEQARWDDERRCVVAERIRRFGALTLHREPAGDIDPATATTLLLDALRKHGIDTLPWTTQARQLQQRIGFLRRLDGADGELPDVADEALLADAEHWLAPWLDGIRCLDELKRLDLVSILLARLSWAQRQRLDDEAPTHITVPSGSRIALRYDGHGAPVLAVRLQELYSARETPTIAGGQVRLRLELLSPARRPVQITNDLAAFWAGSYAEVRKEMKGRYPKHHWPDDPLRARPHRGVKPR